MAIYRVQGPDGSIHKFEGPDDATPDQVTAAAEVQFGGKPVAPKQQPVAEKQQPGNWQVTNNAINKGIAGGIDSVLNLPTNVLNLGKAAVGVGAGALGLGSEYMPEPTPNPDFARRAMTKPGLINQASEPQTELQRILDVSGQFAGGAAVNPAGSGRQMAGNVAKAGIAGLLAGGTKEATGSDAAAFLAGAVAPGVAASAARRVGGTAQALVDPFTTSGQDRIAQRVVQKFAADGPRAVNAQEIVPGSQPTLAEATRNPGIAGLQRSVRDTNPNRFVEREQQNAQARGAQVQNVSGDRQAIANAETAREIAANPLLKKAFQSKASAQPDKVVEIIDTILASPSGKRDAVISTLGNIRSKIIDADGNLETNAANLYGVRKQIGDMLDKKAALSNPAAQQASRELLAVRNQLDKAIEKAAPGFAEYRQTYANQSRPINAMEHLQGLNLTDAQGNVTLAKVNNAITGIERAQAAKGSNNAKSISPQQLDALRQVRQDLLRQSQAQAGRSAGSNTAQNLATQNILANALPGKLGELSIPNNVLGQLGKLVYSGSNEQIRNRLADILLDPSQARLAQAQQRARGPNSNAALQAATQARILAEQPSRLSELLEGR